MFTVHDLWTHVLKSTTHGHEHMVTVLRQLLRQTKVNDAEVVVILRVGKHDVEWLQVQMKYAFTVDEMDSSNNLNNIKDFNIKNEKLNCFSSYLSNKNLALSLCQIVVIRCCSVKKTNKFDKKTNKY